MRASLFAIRTHGKLLIPLLVMFSLSTRAADREPAEYSVGIVPQFGMEKTHNIWEPVLEYLRQHTQLRFRIHDSIDIPAFERRLLAGEFDLAYMNPFHFLLANRKQGYIPLLRDHARMLAGIVVVRKDSPLQSLRELEGKKVAFPSPNALGASLLIRAAFTRLGIEIVPRYVGSHDSVYLNVATGMTSAGGGVQKTLDRQGAGLHARLRVLYRTDPVSPHPLAIHPRVKPAVREQIKTAFLAMARDPAGRDKLSAIPMAEPGPAREQDYDALARMGLERFYSVGILSGEQ